MTVLDMRGSNPLSRSKIKKMRDIILALIGILISPFVLLYELGRYLCKKLK